MNLCMFMSMECELKSHKMFWLTNLFKLSVKYIVKLLTKYTKWSGIIDDNRKLNEPSISLASL